MTAYYNEHDKFAANWLRELIMAGHIAPGFVDERSIEDVRPDELDGYTQCHFFAGIGVWSYALRQAGWPDDEPVWTGSCPCQPFSAAGKGAGFSDERNLWPAWHHLINQRKPGVVFGEQVEAAIRHGWLDLVHTDMEASGYAFWAVGLPASCVGAPHIRHRAWFVAERLADPSELSQRSHERESGQGVQQQVEVRGFGIPSRMADTIVQQRQNGESRIGDEHGAGRRVEGAAATSGFCGDMRPGPTNGLWRNTDWLGCRDGKFRPVEPGTFPLVNGAAARVGRLRGYGNAINAEVASVFIKSYLEVRIKNDAVQ